MDVFVAFKSANDLAVQLITLTTVILTLSIAFMRDVLKTTVPAWALKTSWILLLLSVCFGVWTMMSVTGSFFEITRHPERLNDILDGWNVKIPFALQLFSFAFGIIFLIVYGIRTLKREKKGSSQGGGVMVDSGK